MLSWPHESGSTVTAVAPAAPRPRTRFSRLQAAPGNSRTVSHVQTRDADPNRGSRPDHSGGDDGYWRSRAARSASAGSAEAMDSTPPALGDCRGGGLGDGPWWHWPLLGAFIRNAGSPVLSSARRLVPGDVDVAGAAVAPASSAASASGAQGGSAAFACPMIPAESGGTNGTSGTDAGPITSATSGSGVIGGVGSATHLFTRTTADGVVVRVYPGAIGFRVWVRSGLWLGPRFEFGFELGPTGQCGVRREHAYIFNRAL